MKNFKEEFFKILSLVQEGAPFALSRFSDGEVTVLKNKRLVLAENYFVQGDVYGDNAVQAPIPYMEEERKEFCPEQHSFYQKKLIESFKFRKKNYFKGIPGTNEWGSDSFHYCIDLYEEGDTEHLTFANVLINGNYDLFMKMMVPQFKNRNIVIVCNENANFDDLPFDIQKDFRVGSNCMISNYDLIEEMKNYISKNNVENHTFLFSAATLSNFLIYELYKEFDNNQYIDIGSALSPLLGLQGWRGTRVYLRCYWDGENHPIIRQEDSWG